MKLKYQEESNEHDDCFRSVKSAERDGDCLRMSDCWRGAKRYNSEDGSMQYFSIKISTLKKWIAELDEMTELIRQKRKRVKEAQNAESKSEGD